MTKAGSKPYITPVQLQDNSGNVIDISSGSIPVQMAAVSGAATEAKQDDIIALQTTGNASLVVIAGDTTSLDGKVTACNTGAVVVSSSALPAGASTSAKQPALGTAGTASADVLSVQGIASMTPLVVDGSASTQPVSGTVTADAGSGTFAVSAVSLPLPAGAATAAKQPALGTAGTASADVLSVQGVASMTALVVDGSASTQPISAASLPLPAGAATEATLSNAEGSLGTIKTSTAGIVASHYAEGDAIGGTDTGVLIMGRNGTNAAKPIHITNNGDIEVEIADFVKGQAAKAASFPVVIASDQDTLGVEQSYSYGAEYTVFNAVSIADGANSTSASLEIQSVKVDDPVITFTIDAGGSTNYNLQAIGSHDGVNFFNIGLATGFFGNEMSSTASMGITVPRYMQFNIKNAHGSGLHNFTMKASGVGFTLA
jgi:hypothetical protein